MNSIFLSDGAGCAAASFRKNRGKNLYIETHYRRLTMSTLVQIRLPDEQIARLDALVKRGVYATRSEAIRDAVRRNIRLSVGIIPDTGDSVEEVRAAPSEDGPDERRRDQQRPDEWPELRDGQRRRGARGPVSARPHGTARAAAP